MKQYNPIPHMLYNTNTNYVYTFIQYKYVVDFSMSVISLQCTNLQRLHKYKKTKSHFSYTKNGK